ncbi:MAG: hypothetical protein K0U41_08925 [Gammaproteobacteria bacterium]|nr:hypothetical protein [Gammaproteobacteria bacterium]
MPKSSKNKTIFNNKQGIPLFLAVWLANSDYHNGSDKYPGKEVISATSIMKPTKQAILAIRAKAQRDSIDHKTDLEDQIASSVGTAVHGAVEDVWTHAKKWKSGMRNLGFDENVIQKFMINPSKEDLNADITPVYIEKRSFREIDGVVISGMFDGCMDGQLFDIKTTSCYGWTSNDKHTDYAIQGSIYRWLNPDLITSDTVTICYYFTDWNKYKAQANPNYPQSKIRHDSYPLMSLEDTEAYLKHRIAMFNLNKDLKEADITPCNDEDRWYSGSEYRFFADGSKVNAPLARATRVFKGANAKVEAEAEKAATPGSAYVHLKGVSKACQYCDGYALCTQAEKEVL